MSESSVIDSILDEIFADEPVYKEPGRIITDELPSRESKLERLPTIPIVVPSEEPVSTFLSVLYDNGSISYINLETVPVIQRTIDDTYYLMWPDTSNGIFLKALFAFSRSSDPVAYNRIEAYLASKSK